MLRPKNPGIVPPGGVCRYRDPDTGWEFKHAYYSRVEEAARKHRVLQGFPIPHDWDQWYEEQFCRQNPLACEEIPDGKAETSPGWLQMAANFSKSMIGWAASGFKLVSYEVFKQRYSICAGAPAENGQPARPQCEHFGKFPHFGVMKCRRCGCSGVKLALFTERCPVNKW